MVNQSTGCIFLAGCPGQSFSEYCRLTAIYTMKGPMCATCTLLLACVISVQAWGKGSYQKNNYYEPEKPASVWCVGAAGKCYASGQCCHGYVCAAFNDIQGMSPDIPGYCVKEKELRPCFDHSECSFGLACSVLEGTGTDQKYCMEKQHPKRKGYYTLLTAKGGLGSKCQDNSACKPTAADGSPLCCQEVRGFRQRKTTQCDRVSSISRCIKSPNDL